LGVIFRFPLSPSSILRRYNETVVRKIRKINLTSIGTLDWNWGDQTENYTKEAAQNKEVVA
jgi:hypothetical protein